MLLVKFFELIFFFFKSPTLFLSIIFQFHMYKYLTHSFTLGSRAQSWDIIPNFTITYYDNLSIDNLLDRILYVAYSALVPSKSKTQSLYCPPIGFLPNNWPILEELDPSKKSSFFPHLCVQGLNYVWLVKLSSSSLGLHSPLSSLYILA